VGPLTLPSAGPVYLDAQVLIYSIENSEPYASILDPLWQAIAAKRLEAITSELSLLETLVIPLRNSNQQTESDYRALFTGPLLRLAPVSRDILLSAANLRAFIPKLKTPDAIHCATAAALHATTVYTNDVAWRSVPGLTACVLRDFIGS
jgi:predicted nucleic acid-binding protein